MTAPIPEQVAALRWRRRGFVWLDAGHAPSGWSILAWDPVATCSELDRWQAFARAAHPPVSQAPAAPFISGVLGYLGYGVGHTVEAVPPDGQTPEPAVWLGRYHGSACFHHATQQWHVNGPQDWSADVHDALRTASALPKPQPATGRARPVDAEAFQANVRKILAYIQDGDCYQVNLSRAVHVDAVGDAFEAYRRLRSVSQARFGALLCPAEHLHILSNSPEELLAVDGSRVHATPIKGTRPRGRSPELDERLAQQLLDDPKERAELTMIVDLTRNDLGRVARAGSVHVAPRELSRHATVHHTHQRVTAELRSDQTAWDAVCAVLPYGSITGAPKVRACQRIAELESEGRGAYCGAIGYVADTGRAHFSVAIRTAILHGGMARYHVGGGIVADSTPQAEWDETCSKGRALRTALCADRF